ncbi:MAG TPA: hypothetical protein VNU26_00435 [Mycobacteriales bacterium]|nr:hypothetical protein [Mycobacteriales bacterium]
MNHLAATYALYVLLAVPLTVWVGRTLFRNGKVFLLDVFAGDDDLASAVNSLLVVGFYLVNIGYVLLALRIGTQVTTTTDAFEALSVKLGAVALVLGALHLGNVYVLNNLRRRAVQSSRMQALHRPPVEPDAVWTPTA